MSSCVLFTNARDETHIAEWVAHHLLIGFDKIIIFDHKSKVPISQSVKKFDSRVIVIDCSKMQGGVKLPLMIKAAKIANKLNAAWMLYLDADEFLVLNAGNNIKGIKHYMSHFNSVDQLAVNWLMFGTSHLIDELSLDKGELITEKYTKSDKYINNHVKCFVRPSAIITATNPHYYLINNPVKQFGIDGKIFHPPFHDPLHIPFYKCPIFIAHYVYQSENTYIKRKLDIPRDDNGGMRTDPDVKNIHTRYNECDNFLVHTKYSANTKEYLKHKGVIA